jgi:hypothetical protein
VARSRGGVRPELLLPGGRVRDGPDVEDRPPPALPAEKRASSRFRPL